MGHKMSELMAQNPGWVFSVRGQVKPALSPRQALGRHSTVRVPEGRAEQLFQRSREAYEALAGPDDTRLASVLYNLAGVCMEQGRYAQAESLYRRSLEIREKA